MCRGRVNRRSMYTAASPNADPASERAAATAADRSSRFGDGAHALSATTGHSLDQQGKPDLRAGLE